MLGDTDLTDRHQVEIIRRSVAMLPRSAKAFDREDAMRTLETLQQLLRESEDWHHRRD